MRHLPGEEMAEGCRQMQSYALGNFLLGKLGSWHSSGCYFDMYYPPKNCCRQRTWYTMAMVLPDGCGFFQQDNAPCHTATIVQDGLRNK